MSPEESFDRITRIIVKTIRLPIALIWFVDREWQWCKTDDVLGGTEMS